MYRATTPKHSFIFDVNPETTFQRILITYSQNDNIVLEKQKEDLTFEEGTDCEDNPVWIASLRLTQEETKKFAANPGNQVSVQIRALTNAGEALASEKKKFSVQDDLNDEVLT